jgi:hypothetical protein
MGSYSGDLIVKNRKARQQEIQGKSLNSSDYSGETRMRTQLGNKYYYRNLSDRNKSHLGNFRVKSKFYRDLERQVLSARVHGYQGGPKISLFNRLWIELFDKEPEEKLKKKDNRPQKPHYDTKEAEIWY